MNYLRNFLLLLGDVFGNMSFAPCMFSTISAEVVSTLTLLKSFRSSCSNQIGNMAKFCWHCLACELMINPWKDLAKVWLSFTTLILQHDSVVATFVAGEWSSLQFNFELTRHMQLSWWVKLIIVSNLAGKLQIETSLHGHAVQSNPSNHSYMQACHGSVCYDMKQIYLWTN